MIVLQLLLKQQVLLSSFCFRNCRVAMRFPQEAGYRITCLNFVDARRTLLDLAVSHENFELSHHSSSQ